MIKVEKIQGMLETEYVGKEIHYFKELSSTNTVAKEQAEKGAAEGTVIIAETQAQGRGRLGRTWNSPKGGVWLSIILRPTIDLEDALKMTLITSVAVAQTLQQLCGLKVKIRWPNDVLINEKKICGILTETLSNEKTVNVMIIGIGINVNFDLEALPDDIRTAATTLKETLRRRVDLEKLVSALLKNFEEDYELFKEEKTAVLLNEWRKMAAGFLGKKIEISSFKENWVGRAIDIDEAGALIVGLESGKRRRVLYGDITVIEV